MLEIEKLMKEIVFEKTATNMYFAYIPRIQGLSAYASTKAQCRKELHDLLNDWGKLAK